MGRKGVEIAEAVLREIDGFNYIGRLLSHDRAHVRSLADELRGFGIPARMVQLPDSEFGLPSRFVLVVMADDEMTAEQKTMWHRKAPERGLKLLKEIQEMEMPVIEVEEDVPPDAPIPPAFGLPETDLNIPPEPTPPEHIPYTGPENNHNSPKTDAALEEAHSDINSPPLSVVNDPDAKAAPIEPAQLPEIHTNSDGSAVQDLDKASEKAAEKNDKPTSGKNKTAKGHK